MAVRVVGLALAWLLLSASAAFADAPHVLHVPVLMVHRVQCEIPPGNPNRGLFLCPDTLDAQMALLESKGWHTILADELADDMVSGTCPGAKTFVVTVDDGALDGYTNRAPIWEAHGFRATFAMVVGKAGDYLTGGGGTKPHFSWDQARDLVSRGFGIANHTMLHTAVKNDTTAQLNTEVQAAQDKIQTELGFAPKTFIYPYGSFGTAEQSYLASRFEIAFTDPGSTGAVNGANETTADPMHAPRIRDNRSTSPAALLKALSRYASPC